MTYHFTLILDREPTEDDADGLFEAGCDDSTSGISNGVPFIHFDRDAGSFDQAISSAIANVEASGFQVVKVEIERDEVPSQTA
ncbi:MAG: hypothetical protein H8E66_16990 [Planctomycetes bacterium]|nr:hypothetical protein [Planctomycetota bacterium]